MKRAFALFLAAALGFGLCSCGREGAPDADPSEHSSAPAVAGDSSSQPEAETEPVTEPETQAAEATLQSCHKTIRCSDKPEVTMMSLTAYCTGDLRKAAKVEDIYDYNYYYRGTVGLVGSPMELTLDDSVSKALLSFTYDPDELRGVPEENLICLYSEDDDSFMEAAEGKLDKENCTYTAKAEGSGVYLLADAYIWYSAWGDARAEKYAYELDPFAYETDWEREKDTGSIMELCDKEWAEANAPYFTVSNARELASAVYYVNGISGSVDITLTADIDLEGYDWQPMGNAYVGNPFYGTVDGGGHTIKNMKIDGTGSGVAFIGYGNGCCVKNINFENACVSGPTCVGIVGGEVYSTPDWENIHVTGSIECTGDDYGGIIGRVGNTYFGNCSADVIINGERSQYLTYSEMMLDQTEVIETFTLTQNDDLSITRDDHEGFRNLGWHIEHDGRVVLERSAVDFQTGEPELTLDTGYQWIQGESGRHTIYLTAFIDGQYIRVSNIIEYER